MKSKRLPNFCEDVISTLPSSIIETILCLVPIKDAVRTSILSRIWRYNWTKIPKLVFSNEDMFDRSTDEQRLARSELLFNLLPNERLKLTNKCKLFYAIYQVLLFHEGPILEFTLSMHADNTNIEIDQIIRHLSRHNTLKKLSLNFGYSNYRIPLSIFSFRQLTDLCLHGWVLAREPTFIGFGNLTSLNLQIVNISPKALLLIVSSCPLLKRFTLKFGYYEISGDDDVTIIDILKSLPMIEHLTITLETTELFNIVGIPRGLPITLVHLNYLTIKDMTFTGGFNFSFLDIMIRSSPNLEKIKLLILQDGGIDDPFEEKSVTLGDYSDIWFEHMIELEIDGVRLQHELEFVKLILANSPVLKKVSVKFDVLVTDDEEVKMLRILLRSPRSSPVAEIVAERNMFCG